MMTCYLTQYKIGFVLNLSTSYSRSRKGKNTRIKCQLQSCRVSLKNVSEEYIQSNESIGNF